MRVVFGELFVDDIKRFANVATFIDSKYVVSLDVVEFAAKKAIENWNSGRRISKSLTLEILLYYAATRQIKDAIKLGLRNGLNRVVAVVINEDSFKSIGFKELEFKPEFDLKAIMNHYDITDEELKIVGIDKLNLLIRERIALFSAMGE